jgi:catecholate siderophore receptor
MTTTKTPRTLRAAGNLASELTEYSTRKVSAVAGLIAVASFSGAAEAQQSPLPPVTIDAPVARPRPAAPKPTPDQIRARNALRRASRRSQATRAAPVPFPNAGSLGAADRNPYADAAAPYKVDRLSGSKFSEPLLNTPRTVTVLSKELLDDKNATSMKEVARSTAGVTLGTGEGGNAFGDRFFIRGFDARNDIFIDGVRDPGVSIRENFFTEQVEILRGPASSFAGRGTTGGAINIVTKQAGDQNFYNAETTLGTDQTKRINIDVNQVISPTFSIRADGMWQNADVAGRDDTTDDRWGGLLAFKWTPTDAVKITGNYVHTDLSAIPDFGVPYDVAAKAPFTDVGVNRNTYYGFVNRDFQRTKQDIGTLNGEFHITDALTFENKLRVEKSVLNYIGTIPESPVLTTPLSNSTYTANPLSRYQVTDVVADQSDFTYKFDTGPIKHTTVFGVEVSHERTSIDTYTGLTSEAVGVGAFSGAGSFMNASVFNPPNQTAFPNFNPQLTGNATIIPVDTASGYVIETANWQDTVILNGGIRYDDYSISAYKALTPGTVVKGDSGMTNWNVGITVKPVPFASVYAAYATSSDPVGAEVDGTSANYGGINPGVTVNQIFAPTQSKAAEFGTKWELFDRHLLLTGALFQTTVTNARESVPTGLPNAGAIVAGAAYQIEGIDLEVAGKITDKWSIFGGLVLMNNRVNASVVASNIGQGLANVANQSFNLLSKYKLNDTWEVGGQATYRSKIYGGTLLVANAGTVLPDYWRFDAFVEAKVTQNLTVKLFANNLTNKLYYDAFYQSAAPFVLVAPGRSFSLVANAKF